MEFDEWYATFSDSISQELAESGADREMGFNLDLAYEKRYDLYLKHRGLDV